MSELTKPTAEEIQIRAYELYCSGGCSEGHDLENWLDAEKELSALPEHSVPDAPKARAASAGGQATPSKKSIW